MQRLVVEPRFGWQTIVESQGMSYHSIDDIPYWDEGVCYQFRSSEIDEIEKATFELNRMCLQAVEHVIERNLLHSMLIPIRFHKWIQQSWEQDEHTIYGRFDLTYDGVNPPKLLEYNADTPTGLLEAAVVQWHWLKDLFPEADQFNSIHERLIEAWRFVPHSDGESLYFTALADNPEDFMNVSYLRDTAMQAGWKTEYLNIEEIGWNAITRKFTDKQERTIQNCFKLYPWEWMMQEPFSQYMVQTPVRWLEPPWKAILSNKAILPILWQLFPGHPNLLPSSSEPLTSDCVAKPVFSREGANIRIIEQGNVIVESDGPYDGPVIYQQYNPLPTFDGYHPCIGSWIVNGWACGIGIREDEGLITGNLSRFVPHYFE